MNRECVAKSFLKILALTLTIPLASCGGNGSQSDIATVTITSAAVTDVPSSQLAELTSADITTLETSEVVTEPPTIVNTGIVVEYDTNILMNQSDVRISIDDSVLGTQAQGEKRLYELTLSEGYHDFILSEVGDNTNTNTESIIVSGENNYYYFFVKARNSGYEIEKQDTLTLDEAKSIIGEVTSSNSVSGDLDLTTTQGSTGSETDEDVKTAASELSTSNDVTTESPVTTTTSVLETVAVDAIDIINDYSSNELQADVKYKGKVLEVTGVVSNIDTELFDEDKYILAINGGGDFEFLSVSCYDISTDLLAGLAVGSTVTVVGDFEDGGSLGVIMRNCSIK